MKILVLIYLILIGGILFYSWAEYPLMKMTTDMAISAIEEQFLRENLSAKEKESFDFYARWIRGNQSGLANAWNNMSSALFYLFIATMILNLFNLGCIIKDALKNKKKAEQSSLP